MAIRHWFLIPPVRRSESIDLPAHWGGLDAFEGAGYERVVTTVHMPTGDLDAYIYVLLQLQD